MKENSYDIIIIGGSAGCIPVCVSLLKAFKKDQVIPVTLIIHRMRNVVSELDTLLAREAGIKKLQSPRINKPLTRVKCNWHRKTITYCLRTMAVLVSTIPMQFTIVDLQ